MSTKLAPVPVHFHKSQIDENISPPEINELHLLSRSRSKQFLKVVQLTGPHFNEISSNLFKVQQSLKYISFQNSIHFKTGLLTGQGNNRVSHGMHCDQRGALDCKKLSDTDLSKAFNSVNWNRMSSKETNQKIQAPLFLLLMATSKWAIVAIYQIDQRRNGHFSNLSGLKILLHGM